MLGIAIKYYGHQSTQSLFDEETFPSLRLGRSVSYHYILHKGASLMQDSICTYWNLHILAYK